MDEIIMVGLVGVTNSGKSTLLNALRSDPTIGLIEVGKEMRRRHPPEYFDGQGAMAKTEAEVWEIVDEQYAAAVRSGRRMVICDGQPRLPGHVEKMVERFGLLHLLQLHADHDVLEERARRRDSDPQTLELSHRRLTNDYIQLYQVLAEWHIHPQSMLAQCETIDTTGGEGFIPAAVDFLDGLKRMATFA